MFGRALFLSALLSAVLLAGLAAASARADDLVRKESPYPVAETIDRLAALADERGLSVAARIDHAAAAEGAGLTLGPVQVLVFGNPRIGTPLMQEVPALGLDLPMRVVAWRDASGTVWLAYRDPARLAANWGVAADHPAIARMSAGLKGLTDAATAD